MNPSQHPAQPMARDSRLDIQNNTPFACHTQLSAHERGWMAVTIVKATFDILSDGSLEISDRPIPFHPVRVNTSFGILQSDLLARKRGCDLCILGHVQRGAPVRWADLDLHVDGHRLSSIRVWGDRVWQVDQRGTLFPSSPKPFTRMPMSYERAYGGSRHLNDGTEVTDALNPGGRGHYRTRCQAYGRALPNLECRDHPSRRWDQARPVVGWGPYPKPRRSRGRPPREPLRSNFNQAHPDLILDKAPVGRSIEITGMRDQPLRYCIPNVPANITVHLGDTCYPLHSDLDGIYIWVDTQKLVLTQRARVIYTPHIEQERSIRISYCA